MLFKNREAAGKLLAKKLGDLGILGDLGKDKGLVLGIPRGGVVTAKVVAERLGWPLSVVIVKKIGAPAQSELAVGAISEDGQIVWEEEVLASLGISGSLAEPEKRLKAEIERAREKIQDYQEKFRLAVGRSDLVGKVVIIVDDGVATGSTALAAARFSRRAGAKGVILATPVIAADTVDKLAKEVDELVYLEAPEYFAAVGQFYQRFEQVEDVK